MTLPCALGPTGKVAIVSPANIISPSILYRCMARLADMGINAYTMPNVQGRHGTQSGTKAERIADITQALLDPSTQAILCSRGGYGCVDLLQALDNLPLADNPKWLIGYSDVTALHALMRKKGIVSIHSPMARHIAEQPLCDPHTRRLLQLLRHDFRPLEWAPHPLDRRGTATGTLTGGNLSVLAGLFSTPYDPVADGDILVIEDINEPIYKLERMLQTLRLRGTLGRLGGLITGRFAGTAASPDYPCAEAMVAALTAPYSYPVAMGAPIGHTPDNAPLALGMRVTLTVGNDCTKIQYKNLA